MITDDVKQWLSNGADLLSGVRLYLNYSQNDAFKLLIAMNAEAVKKQLFESLIRIGGVDDPILVESQRRFFIPSRKVKLRDRWCFLDDRNCPDELKILAADKITAWRDYLDAYSCFSGCETCSEYFDAAKRAMVAFAENDLITKEFDYYVEHGNILGSHPVFAHQRQIAELKKLGPVKLTKRQEQLAHTIWRIKKVLADGKRPDLRVARERSLIEKEAELSEVVRLLEVYV